MDYPSAKSPSVSAVMRGNVRRDTRPELALRSELWKRGLRYRVDMPLSVGGGLTVRPDIIFTRARIAVFVDGCYWHACPLHWRLPKHNVEYWTKKVERNRLRDIRVNEGLIQSGWAVVRLWEHDAVIAGADSIEEAVHLRGRLRVNR